jgi:hypothetical protein
MGLLNFRDEDREQRLHSISSCSFVDLSREILAHISPFTFIEQLLYTFNKMSVLLLTIIHQWDIANLFGQIRQYFPAGCIDRIDPNFLNNKIPGP